MAICLLTVSAFAANLQDDVSVRVKVDGDTLEPNAINRVSFERGEASLLISNKGKYFDNLNKALTRINYGNYGICTKCGELLSKELLKAVPTTTQCIKWK